MNYLKKKLKPLTAGLTASNNHTNKQKDLEDDLYDEYVVEAPPHPSELLALGIEPSEIDVNDPDKLRELYKKAKEEGKDKKTNSILLAKQRQKEEIEEKKKSAEEWKFFNNLTLRVEQVVKESQKNLDQLKGSSAIETLAEPDYELRLTPDQVFRPTSTVKLEKEGENSWVDFGDEDSNFKTDKSEGTAKDKQEEKEEFDEFGCPKRKLSVVDGPSIQAPSPVVDVLLEDFGIDLRTAEQRKAIEEKQRELERQQQLAKAREAKSKGPESPKKLDIDIKAAARPRPRPGKQQESEKTTTSEPLEELDPFDTSFVAPPADSSSLMLEEPKEEPKESEQPKVVDPFDTSYVNL